EDHYRPAPGQARRPAGDPDRPGKRLPHRRTIMHFPRPGPPRWLRLPRRTARLRLTVLYGAAFLACGAAVLAVVAYLLFWHTATDLPSGQPKSSASVVFHGKVPIADVQRAGGYDIVKLPVEIPVADVQQAGGY